MKKADKNKLGRRELPGPVKQLKYTTYGVVSRFGDTGAEIASLYNSATPTFLIPCPISAFPMRALRKSGKILALLLRVEKSRKTADFLVTMPDNSSSLKICPVKDNCIIKDLDLNYAALKSSITD